MITPMQMYWLLKLDDIRAFILFAICFMLLVIVVSLAAYRDDACESVKKVSQAMFIFGLLGAWLLGCVVTFLPSTKQMAAMYVVPDIVNNKKVQQIGNRTLDITNQLLDFTKDYLTEKEDNK